MKKFLFLSATALAGAMSMVSCSSEDEVKPQDGKREEVKTSFTLSVGSVKPGTRMTADASQADNLFNGMTGIQLFPFIKGSGAVEGTENITITPIHLDDFEDFDANLKKAQAKKYTDVAIPIGVDNFVFYGMTKMSGAWDDENGALSASYDINSLVNTKSLAEQINFNLVPRYQYTIAQLATQEEETAKKVLTALNGIVTVLKTQYDAADDASDPMTNGINEVYEAWRSMKAGSSASVLELATDAYNRLISLTTTSNTYVDAAKSAFKSYFVVPETANPNGTYTLEWKDADPDFPGCLGLPDGAIGVKYTDQFAFAALQVDGMTQPELTTYTYPARLAYFVNTTAKTSTSPVLDGIEATEPWSEVQSQYSGNAVALNTQSVILNGQIQYGVGRLDVQVRVSESTLKDSKEQLVLVPSTGYTFNALLIGGQKQVGWNFETTGTKTTTIYDRNIVDDSGAPISALQGGTFSNASHTLALETTKDETIRICLEFVNNGNDFMGANNQLIPAGGKFYLVTQLDPTAVDPTEAAKTEGKVFKQDYTTIAQLTIGANSLKSAYNVIPDLRSPKLELGLSVDLEWETGITFEQEF